LFPAVTGLGEAVKVIPRAAEATTGVVTVAEWGLVESVGLETLAVFTMFEPLGALELTWTTTVKVAEAPAARVAVVPVIVPVPPTAGLLNVNVTPLFWASDTNVVLLGTLSVSWTFCALDGPLLVSVIV
jgi:hypothetical protein